MTTFKRQVINYLSVLTSLAVMACQPTPEPTPVPPDSLTVPPVTTPVMSKIELTAPLEYLVHQRDNSNRAAIPVTGTAPAGSDRVVVQLKPTNGGTAVQTTLTPNAAGYFTGPVVATGGQYELAVTAYQANAVVGTGSVGRVNIGEVFMIFGHSVAQGGKQEDTGTYGDTSGPGATDERVIVPTTPTGTALSNKIDENSPTSCPRYFRPLRAGVPMAPYHAGPYVYGLLGDKLVKQLNVPVMFLGCAYGGTNLGHSVKVIQGIPFEHGFVPYADRMPIRPVEAALQVYTPLSGGLRGVLLYHGTNDRFEVDAAGFRDRVALVASYIRQKAGRADLPFWIAVDDAPNLAQMRAGQELAISNVPNCRRGLDLSKLQAADRPDGIHLAERGFERYAQGWADVLSQSALFGTSIPAVQGQNVGGGTGSSNRLASLTTGLATYAPPVLLVVSIVLLALVAWRRKRTLLYVAGGFAALASGTVIYRQFRPTTAT